MRMDYKMERKWMEGQQREMWGGSRSALNESRREALNDFVH